MADDQILPDAVLEAMARAQDTEESAQKGEPSPWRDDLGGLDSEWKSERRVAMQCAVQALVDAGYTMTPSTSSERLHQPVDLVAARTDEHCKDPAVWMQFGVPYSEQPRSHSDLSDFELANAVFMADRHDLNLIGFQAAAKERIRWLSIHLALANASNAAFIAEVEAGREALNTPELNDFAAGVVAEGQHQRVRWGSSHDAGKAPLDWFWLIGFLAQKAATAAIAGDTEKAKHHTISTAAALEIGTPHCPTPAQR